MSAKRKYSYKQVINKNRSWGQKILDQAYSNDVIAQRLTSKKLNKGNKWASYKEKTIIDWQRNQEIKLWKEKCLTYLENFST